MIKIKCVPRAPVAQKFPFKSYSTPYSALLGPRSGFLCVQASGSTWDKKFMVWLYYELCERECVCVVFFVLLRAFGAHGLLRTLSPYLQRGAFMLSSLFCVRATFSLQEAALACTKGHVMWCNAVFLGRGRVSMCLRICVSNWRHRPGQLRRWRKKLWRRSLRADTFLSDLYNSRSAGGRSWSDYRFLTD